MHFPAINWVPVTFCGASNVFKSTDLPGQFLITPVSKTMFSIFAG